MKKQGFSASILLVAVTIAWGYGFVLTRIAIDAGFSTGLINIIRGGVFAALTLVFFRKHIYKITGSELKKGLLAGGMNALAFILQTVALEYTSPANGAFLTVTYVLIIPFISWIFYKKRPSVKLLFCAAICMAGMVFLTGLFDSKFSFNIGDILALGCAVLYALSIAYVSHSLPEIHFSKIAFLFGVTQALAGLFYFLVFEGAGVGTLDWGKAAFPLLFMSIVGSFFAQSGQVYSEQRMSPTAAALIMTLEGFFGGIFSLIYGFDKLSLGFVLGGILIAASLVLYVLPVESAIMRIKEAKRAEKNGKQK